MNHPVENFLKDYFHQKWNSENSLLFQDQSLKKFKDSVEYTLLGPGKRFRTQLCLAVADGFQLPHQDFLPLAAAIEMIHAYTLIHDDLPCLDNDDSRRGMPTNHKVFGEAMALLAGDGLLSESFLLISEAYKDSPTLALQLVQMMSRFGGISGVIAGQVADMFSERTNHLEFLTQVHIYKTAALMSASIEGSALIATHSSVGDLAHSSVGDLAHKPVGDLHLQLRKVGQLMGLSFQIADDLIDYAEWQRDHRNWVTHEGVEMTRKKLQALTSEGLALLKQTPLRFDQLEKLFVMNLERT